MTTEQLRDYLDNIQEIYSTKPKNKFEYDVWFKAFDRIDPRVANKMLEIHMYHNDKPPKISNLLEHKDEAYNSLKDFLTSIEKKVECKECNGLGVIFVELEDYVHSFRCTCQNGNTREYLPLMTNDIIKDNKLVKDYNGTWRKVRTPETPITNELLSKVKAIVARGREDKREEVREVKQFKQIIL